MATVILSIITYLRLGNLNEPKAIFG